MIIVYEAIVISSGYKSLSVVYIYFRVESVTGKIESVTRKIESMVKRVSVHIVKGKIFWMAGFGGAIE